MTVLKSLLTGNRAIQATTWGQWAGDPIGPAWSGVSVDEQSALQQVPTVYGCVKFIADGIATLPIDTFRDTVGGPVEATKPAWLIQPTVDLDFISWSGQVITSLLMDGNFYGWIRRSPLGEIEELVPLNPERVKVTREQGARVYRINGQQIDSFDVLHIPGIMFPGADVGLSPLEAARQTIGKNFAVDEFGARFFAQGMNAGGVIETQDDLSDESARAMAKTFARRHAGKRNAHLPAVMVRGAKWVQTQITGEQAQFLQTMQFTRAEICAFLFLIDPTEFGVSMDKGSSVTYANLEQRNARKVQVTFLPWIIRIENALSKLIRQSNRYVKFNVNGLLRADLQTRYASYAIGIDHGFLLKNEAREKEDLPPIPGGSDPTPAPAPSVPAPAPAPAAPTVNNNFGAGFVQTTVQPAENPAPIVHNHLDVPAPVVVNNVDVPEPVVHVETPVQVAGPNVTVAAAEVPPAQVTVLERPESSKRLEYNELGDVVRIVVEE